MQSLYIFCAWKPLPFHFLAFLSTNFLLWASAALLFGAFFPGFFFIFCFSLIKLIYFLFDFDFLSQIVLFKHGQVFILKLWMRLENKTILHCWIQKSYAINIMDCGNLMSLNYRKLSWKLALSLWSSLCCRVPQKRGFSRERLFEQLEHMKLMLLLHYHI